MTTLKHGTKWRSRRTITEWRTTSSTAVKKLHDRRRHSAISSPLLRRRLLPDLFGRRRLHQKHQIRFQWTSMPLERSTTHRMYADDAKNPDIGPKTATGGERGMATELSVGGRRSRGGRKGEGIGGDEGEGFLGLQRMRGMPPLQNDNQY